MELSSLMLSLSTSSKSVDSKKKKKTSMGKTYYIRKVRGGGVSSGPLKKKKQVLVSFPHSATPLGLTMYLAQRKAVKKHVHVHPYIRLSPYGRLCRSPNPQRYGTGTRIALPYEPYYTVTVWSPRGPLRYEINTVYKKEKRERREGQETLRGICERQGGAGIEKKDLGSIFLLRRLEVD